MINYSANNGAKAEKSGNGREILPAGGYVATIIGAKIENTQWGAKLVLAFDIAEGDYRGIFKRDFDSNTREDKKWRGTYRLNIPADDGSERDGWAKNKFNNFIFALEDSNSGYHYDCDETKMKGKTIGVVFRNREWSMDGRSGWTTECGAIYSAADIRDGKYKQLDDKHLSSTESATATSFSAMTSVSEADLPF